MTTTPDEQTTPAAPSAPTAPSATPDPVDALRAEVGTKLDALAKIVEAALTAKPAPPVVPETDTDKPTVTPREVDFTTLPPVARMAAGYRK